MDYNTQKNLGDQDKFELLMIFPGEENIKIMDDVLKANGESEAFKNEFSTATYNPEFLEQLRIKHNVQIRQPVPEQRAPNQQPGISPYQPPQPQNVLSDDHRIDTLGNFQSDRSITPGGYRMQGEDQEEVSALEEIEEGIERANSEGLDQSVELSENEEFQHVQNYDLSQISNHVHSKRIFSSKNQPKMLNIGEDDGPKPEIFEVQPMLRSTTRSILKPRTQQYENNDSSPERRRSVRFQGLPSIDGNQPKAREIFVQEPVSPQSEEIEQIEIEENFHEVQFIPVQRQPIQSAPQPEPEELPLIIPDEESINNPIDEQKLKQLKSTKIKTNQENQPEFGLIRSTTRLIKNNDQDRERIRQKVETRLKQKKDDQYFSESEKKQLNKAQERAKARKKKLQKLETALKGNIN